MSPLALPTCPELANNGTYQLSYEGSWSYLEFDPKHHPFSMGKMGYRVYSDWGGHKPLYPKPLELTGCQPHKTNYKWRPDFAVTKGTCGSLDVTMSIAYLSNATMCTKYELIANNETIKVEFSGDIPTASSCKAKAEAIPKSPNVLIETNVTCSGSYKWKFRRWWLLQTTLSSASITSTSYSWTLDVQPGHPEDFTFCMTEMTTIPEHPDAPCPNYDPTPTTKAIDTWLADLPPPDSHYNSSNQTHIMYYVAWYQFWFNTEHAENFWVRPVITPSMSQYGRGMWLWDSAFHVFALLQGGPLGLVKAQDQLEVLTTAGMKLGHIPRVVGAYNIETTTQPPGILTWASLVVFNRTKDLAFLARSYDAFTQNNNWFYATRDPQGDGLCQWKGQDSGWDTSPRWDKGMVEAIDLNSWLHLDQLLLAEMAKLLGNHTGQAYWEAAANRSKDSVSKLLWDDEAGVYWDRVPKNDVPHCSQLPGPFCDCHGGCPETSDHCSCHECGTCTNCPHCTCCLMDNVSSTFVKVITPATFWSMLAGIATQSQAHRMVDKVIQPANLMTPYPMPCVGRSEKTFQPTNYWRGPVWINVNWLSAIGLDCYGLRDYGHAIRNATVTVVAINPDPREYYNPLTGGGLGAHNFMWTGAVYITVVQELRGNTAIADILHAAVKCP